MYSPVFLLRTLNKQPPNSLANTAFVLLQPQPTQHSTCSARGFPEAALKPELVWQHHSHLRKEFKISRPISCMSWSLGIISFGSIPADSDLRSGLWTLATPWILAPTFCVLWLCYKTAASPHPCFFNTVSWEISVGKCCARCRGGGGGNIWEINKPQSLQWKSSLSTATNRKMNKSMPCRVNRSPLTRLSNFPWSSAEERLISPGSQGSCPELYLEGSLTKHTYCIFRVLPIFSCSKHNVILAKLNIVFPSGKIPQHLTFTFFLLNLLQFERWEFNYYIDFYSILLQKCFKKYLLSLFNSLFENFSCLWVICLLKCLSFSS